MTKSELVVRLSQRFPNLSHEDVDKCVNEILNGIKNTLVSGNRVEVRGFGVFHLTYRQPRVGRNPKSGIEVQVNGKYVPHFRAGKELKEKVEHVNGVEENQNTNNDF